MIAASTTARPIAALREISPPQVGPASSMFTSTGSIPACSARSRRIASEPLTPSTVSEGVGSDLLAVHDLDLRIVDPVLRERRSDLLGADRLRRRVVIRAPPSKSIEKFDSRKMSPPSESTIKIPEIANQRLRCSTHRTCGIVWPR